MRGIYILILILFPTYFNGQEILRGIHGLISEKGEQLFEVEGYSISVYETKGSLDNEATIRLIERAYQLDHISKRYTDLMIN